jgi:hypothetical protein
MIFEVWMMMNDLGREKMADSCCGSCGFPLHWFWHWLAWSWYRFLIMRLFHYQLRPDQRLITTTAFVASRAVSPHNNDAAPVT